MAEHRVLERMREQHGVITHAQALEDGMTYAQVRQRLSSGLWVHVARGVYRHSVVPETLISRLLAACEAHDGLASHRSAAALHRIDGFELDRVEIVMPVGRTREIKGVKLHESSQMGLTNPVDIDGVPTTCLRRTFVDLAAVVSRKRLDYAIDSVLRDRRLRLIDLERVLAAHSRRGRDGCGKLRAALEDRCGEDRVPLSAWSRMVATLLTGSGLPRPVLEHRVEDAQGTFVAQVDLAYPSHCLAIELDSKRWHMDHVSFEADRQRRNRLIQAGWQVLNFTWDYYKSSPESLCALVREAMAAVRSSPSSEIPVGNDPTGPQLQEFRRTGGRSQ